MKWVDLKGSLSRLREGDQRGPESKQEKEDNEMTVLMKATKDLLPN